MAGNGKSPSRTSPPWMRDYYWQLWVAKSTTRLSLGQVYAYGNAAVRFTFYYGFSHHKLRHMAMSSEVQASQRNHSRFLVGCGMYLLLPICQYEASSYGLLLAI